VSVIGCLKAAYHAIIGIVGGGLGPGCYGLAFKAIEAFDDWLHD